MTPTPHRWRRSDDRRAGAATMSRTGPSNLDASDALSAALERLSALHPKKIDLSLGRIERLLEALGRPQDRLPPVVHVAGTNGKGSTVAFLRAMAEAAGRTAHVYTSPHLLRFTERIVVAGREITPAALMTLIARVERANAGAPITFFEITTALALLAFSETPADLTLLEVGLGGRFDATNVIAPPACTIITPVGLDHKEFLGEDLATIAWEKAGILKAGVPAIIGPQEGEARASIAAEALAVGAQLRIWGTDYRAYADHGRLVVESETQLWDLPAPGLRGAHQVVNAGVAAAAAQVLDFEQDTVAKGVEKTRWAGRLEMLKDGVLADMAAENHAELWVDGAHNAMAGAALARALADMDDAAPRPLILIIGMQKNKDPAAFLKPFQGLTYGVVTTPLAATAACWAPDALAETATNVTGAPARTAKDVCDAVRVAVEDAPESSAPRIVITGSLYLVGEALGFHRGETPSATVG